MIDDDCQNETRDDLLQNRSNSALIDSNSSMLEKSNHKEFESLENDLEKAVSDADIELEIARSEALRDAATAFDKVDISADGIID